MLQKLVVLIAALVALPLATSAQTVIPPNVNLHHGYIVVRNEVNANAHDVMDVVIRNAFGNIVDTGRVVPGATILLNQCCFVAGSEYTLTGYGANVHFRPQLCNVRGIPFGYAVIVFTGRIYYMPNNPRAILDLDPVARHVSCPVDPPTH